MSVFIHEMANMIGSAGKRSGPLGHKIAFFRPVLEEVQAMLTKAAARRAPITGLQTMQDILDNWMAIFAEIDTIPVTFRKASDYSFDILARVGSIRDPSSFL